MTKINDLTGREQAFSSAARRFPQAEFTIRRLMRMSEDFYDLCGELAEAEDALARFRNPPGNLKSGSASGRSLSIASPTKSARRLQSTEGGSRVRGARVKRSPDKSLAMHPSIVLGESV